MAWKTALITIAFILSSCATMRQVDVCKLKFKGDSIKKIKVPCAIKGKRKSKPLSELEGHYVISETDLRKFAGKLVDAEVEAKRGKK